MGGNGYSWILMGHLAQLWREKKTSLYFGSLLMSFESIMTFTKKKPCLLSLRASILFNNSIGVKNCICWTCE